MITKYTFVTCALLIFSACGGTLSNSDEARQQDSGTATTDSSPDTSSEIVDSSPDTSFETSDSSVPDPVIIQEGGTSPDVTPPMTATIHAIGSSWQKSPRYWKVNLAKNTQESVDLGTEDLGAHSLALLGGKAYILASNCKLWVVDKGVVSLIDLVSKAGSKLVPLGVHADQSTIHVLCRREQDLSQIDHFFGHDSEFQHSSTSVEAGAYVGASALSNGRLYLAGQWQSKAAYAVLEGNGWVSHPMSPEPSLRGIYGMAVVGDTVHAAGDLSSGVAAYFRAEPGVDPTLNTLKLAMGGTITTDVAVEGDSVYLGGAKSSGFDFVETRPVYFRLDKNGTATAVATFLEEKDGYETWINAIRVQNKTVIAGGSDNNLPVIWVDYDADGINVQRIDLDKPSKKEASVLSLVVEE